jgi:hypothetical protein
MLVERRRWAHLRPTVSEPIVRERRKFRDRRWVRDRHSLDGNVMVVCNSREEEADAIASCSWTPTAGVCCRRRPGCS